MCKTTIQDHYGQYVKAGIINKAFAEADSKRFQIPCYAYVCPETGRLFLCETQKDNSIAEIHDGERFAEMIRMVSQAHRPV